jgi:hypothetical protein
MRRICFEESSSFLKKAAPKTFASQASDTTTTSALRPPKVGRESSFVSQI